MRGWGRCGSAFRVLHLLFAFSAPDQQQADHAFMSVNADELVVSSPPEASGDYADAWPVVFRRRVASHAVVRAGALGLAFVVAAVVPPAVSRAELVWFLLFAVFVYAFDLSPTLSKPHLRLDTLNEIRDLVLRTTVAAMAVLSIRVLVTDDPTSAAETVRMWGSAIAFLVLGSLAAAQFELRARRRGAASRRALIIGAGNVGRLAAKRLLAEPDLGLKPVGFLDDSPLSGNGGPDLPLLGASSDLEEVVRRNDIEHVILTFATTPHNVLLDIMRRCEARRIAVSIVPRLFERMTTTIGIDYVGGLPLISPQRVDPRGWQFRVKYMFDRLIAGVGIVFTAPILLGTALAVWMSLGRPILYRQRRVGRDGHEFGMLKFRSMSDGSDDEDFPSLLPGLAPGGVEGADRRTSVGRFIRRTSLDELPQLINVLRGEMSLVGPRPERPEFAEMFERDVYRYAERLRVKSGMTGWAQVHGLRGRTSLSDRVEWDNYYIENWSLWLDCKILLLTIRSMLRFPAD
jgi:exopolysaccharide biosynthesis polyprenyl glycosylphosphotransferase